MAATASDDLSVTYQKKTQKEHIKDAPDTYIGAIEPDDVKTGHSEMMIPNFALEHIAS